MNEKLIKDLAAQCGMHFGQDKLTHNAYVTPPGRHEEGVELAKFAELIVQECKNVLRKEYYNENDKATTDMNEREVAMYVGRKDAMITALGAIVKHFEDNDE